MIRRPDIQPKARQSQAESLALLGAILPEGFVQVSYPIKARESHQILERSCECAALRILALKCRSMV